jgi:hypothetical protein
MNVKEPEAMNQLVRGVHHRSIIAVIVMLLATVACVGERGTKARRGFELATGGTCGDYYLGDIRSSFGYQMGSNVADHTAGVTVTMTFPDEVSTPILATYQVTLTIPSQFVFLGFDSLGSGVQIGAWDFEWSNVDGVFDGADFTIVHRSIDFDTAYSDSDGSGSYTPGVDPSTEYSTGAGGVHVITLTLPDGGMDQATYGMCSYFSFDARYTLLDGIVRLPNTAADYTVELMAISVDLDTGNATDNVSPHPLTYTEPFVVSVVGQGHIFSDGFESSDTSAWSATKP